jgi:hypothetical protein
MKLLKSITLFSILFFALSVANAQSASVSKIAGKAAVGDKADSPWDHLEGMYSDTTSQAICSLEPGQNSDNIILSNFNFSIPSGAIIKGVKITLEKQGGTMGFTDKTVRLIINGQPLGNNYALNDYWRTEPTRAYYGSETNLWGLNLTASDINSPDFGVMLQVANSDMGSTSTAQLGFIRVTVTYVNSSGERLTVSGTVQTHSVN